MKRIVFVSVVFLCCSTLAFGEVGEQQGRRASRLIIGLDGGDYDPYKPSLVRRAQEVLTEKDLYSGEAHGKLDQATMEALGEFQKANGLVATGIPTPKTRKKLFEESRGEPDRP